MRTPQNEPLVSVIMGVRYRLENLKPLEQAIQSILDQTYRNLELLICEYNSTAPAKAWLAELAQQDCRIHLLQGREPGFLPQNLNDCLVVAKGAYIARMDDDDFSYSERLKRQVTYQDTHPEIAIDRSNDNLHRAGAQVGQRTFPEFPSTRDFYMTQPFLHPALVFRREALDAVDWYSEDKHCVLCEDYDLLLRLYAKEFKGANIQEVLMDYTIPATAKGNRTMGHRWNETVTRYRRFRELKVLPGALPWVVKPLIVGFIPESLLSKLKNQYGTGG